MQGKPKSLWNEPSGQLALSIALIVGACLLAYFNSFSVPFVFDDSFHIENNPRVTDNRPLLDVMSHTNRPFVFLSLAFNYRISGLNTGGYHGFNFAVHILTALTLLAVLRRTFLSRRLAGIYKERGWWLALVMALLWALHPLQTQSVTYIIQRSESMMGLFYLLTLYCVIRSVSSPRAWRWVIGAFASCFLGMGCKEIMVTAPLIILVYDRIFLAGSFEEIINRRKWHYALLAANWLWLWKLFSSPRVNIFDPVLAFDVISPWQYALSQTEVIFHYLRLAVWPSGLTLDYAWPLAESFMSVWPSAAGILLLGAFTLWALRRCPELGFWGIWFFVILAPTSSLIPIQDLAFEHRMYLPLAGVMVMAVLSMDYGLRKIFDQEGARKATAGLAVILIISALFATIQRNKDYASSLKIWQDVLEKQPRNARAMLNYGNALLNEGKYSEAFKIFQEATAINPDFEKIQYALGLTSEMLERPQEAKDYYQEALRLNPDFNQAHINLGRILLKEGGHEQALVHFETALLNNPEDPLAIRNYALAMIALGRHEGIIRHFEDALELSPNAANLHHELGMIYFEMEKLDLAIQHFLKAVALRPQDVVAHYNLGTAYANSGNFPLAAAHFSEVVRLKPDFQDAHSRLVQLRLLGNASALNPAAVKNTESGAQEGNLKDDDDLTQQLENPDAAAEGAPQQ